MYPTPDLRGERRCSDDLAMLLLTNLMFCNAGIAVDWVGRNLYWLDMRADKIEVSKLNGSHRSVLINTDIDSPRALQVDPVEGYVFYIPKFQSQKRGTQRYNSYSRDR